MFLILPPMVLASTNAIQFNMSFPLYAVYSMAWNLALSSLILFLVWRSGAPLISSLGLGAVSIYREVFVGLTLFFPFLIGMSLVKYALPRLDMEFSQRSLDFFIPQGAWQAVLALVFIVVVAISEEIIYRGYLMWRFGTITRSPAGTVILSSLVFSIGHGYQGPAGFISACILGGIFGIIYLWRKSLAATVVMHFLYNFIVILGIASST